MADKHCIYVVDDEQVIGRTLCLILNTKGYETSMFISAESAWERIEESPPDLVLSDVVLTGQMTGIDLAERLAAHYPNVKIMLMSGQAQTSELIDRAHARGFNPMVHAKPIAPQKLLDEIAKSLRR